MKKFIYTLIVFGFVTIIVGEIMVRLTHAVSDIPKRTIDENGIQKYYPNQEGYWKGGEHKWMINKFGWPGILPKKLDNLIAIIGDSYIENFMNPNECHQSFFLKEKLQKNNFIEAGRSGVSFIESMEISKQLDSLKPKQTLIYVNDNDFYESIHDYKPLNDITQIDLKTKKIIHGQLKSMELKKILYSCKLLYYLYNRFTPRNQVEVTKNSIIDLKELEINSKIFELIEYVSINYSIKNKILVFHPNSNKSIIEACKKKGFNVIILDSSGDKSWTFDYDSHWTCYGHERVAQQVYKNLLKLPIQS